MLVYRVREGESLQDVARKFGVRAEKILADSNCAPDQFDRGICLLIRRPEGREYVVKPFDTLQSVAEKFGVSKEKIMSDNCLDTPYIFIGQKLYL